MPTEFIVKQAIKLKDFIFTFFIIELRQRIVAHRMIPYFVAFLQHSAYNCVVLFKIITGNEKNRLYVFLLERIENGLGIAVFIPLVKG